MKQSINPDFPRSARVYRAISNPHLRRGVNAEERWNCPQSPRENSQEGSHRRSRIGRGTNQHMLSESARSVPAFSVTDPAFFRDHHSPPGPQPTSSFETRALSSSELRVTAPGALRSYTRQVFTFGPRIRRIVSPTFRISPTTAHLASGYNHFRIRIRTRIR